MKSDERRERQVDAPSRAAARVPGARVLVVLGFAPLALASRGLAQDEGAGPRGFAIPETRQAADKARRALEHFAAKRDNEALQLLHELITDHRGEVLLAPDAESTSRAAPVYVGAVDWARRRLGQVPPATLESYRARHEAGARAQLDSALARRDGKALAELARRYPRTLPAVAAWRALGDLELERGDRDAAALAWRRATDLESALGAPSGPGAAARAGEVEKWSGAENARPAPSLPGADAATWVQSLAPENAQGPFSRGDTYCLHASVEGDSVYVSDTMRVWAFDAWSGERRWVSAELEEWRAVDRGLVNPNNERPLKRDDFFEKVDRSQLFVRPAASAGVVVAALQTPFTQVGNRNYQHFEITSVMPERRLVAFDAASGAVLWSHLPPPMWNGEGGPFEQRTSVSTAPEIVGARVLVASHSMRGRVDFHVACYDLHDGRLLWSTPLVSGQVELNMFGRPLREFSAAPIAVHEDRVIVATQLGAVAALDLFSGDILWETLYDQTPAPRAEHWRTELRRRYWSNGPPAVADGVVLAAPVDSRDLVAFDLASGERQWRRSHDTFERGHEVLDFLHAERDTLWLSGERIVAARSPRGWRTAGGPTSLEQSVELLGSAPRPRPALGAQHVIVPCDLRRVAIDRARLNEDRRLSADWAAAQYAGNVALGDGAAYFVSDSRVSASVDWRAVSDRYARACAAAPDDPRPHLGWASILARRGISELGAGAADDAARTLQDAAQRLERFLDTQDAQLRSQVRERYVESALLAADALSRAAALRQALEWTQRAVGTAERRDQLASGLVRKAELEQSLRLPAERAQTLDELERRCTGAPMPDDWRQRDDAQRYDTLIGTREMTVEQFVALERALAARRDRDAAREFEVLHDVLARFGDVALPLDTTRGRDLARTTASARVGALLAEGERAAYEPYEQAAAKWLERARAADDLEALEELSVRFPHSRAAAAAERARLESALAHADVQRVIQLALRAIPDEWDIAAASDEQLHALFVLRAAMAEAGNHEFAAALCERLERAHGESASPLPRDGGRTVRQLAEESRRALPIPTPAERTLTPSFEAPATHNGSYLLLGRAPSPTVEGDVRWAQLLCLRGRNFDIVSAWAGDGRDRPIWSTQTPQGAAFPGWSAQVGAGSVILGNRSGLLALECDTGEVRWQWSAGASRIDSFQVSDGVAVVATPSGERNALVALDACLGLELWARPTPAESWSRPIVGGGVLALLPSDFAQTPAQFVDLFTGGRTASASLSSHVGLADVEGAWIEQGRLILPSFPKSSASVEHDCVTAWDVTTGRRAWRVIAEAQQEFDSVLRAEGRTYLILLPRAATGRAANGAILDLDVKIGAVRRVQNAALGPQDVLIGVPRRRVVETDHSYLFVRGDEGGSAEVRALHLPFGERWRVPLELPPAQLNSAGPMPGPIVAERSVALFYGQPPRGKPVRGGTGAQLLLVDLESGAVLERSGLPAELGAAEKLEFAALGSTLWISGLNQMIVRRSP